MTASHAEKPRETPAAEPHALHETVTGQETHAVPTLPARRRFRWGRVVGVALVVAAASAAAGAWKYGVLQDPKPPAAAEQHVPPPPVAGDGYVLLSATRQQSLGLSLAVATAQDAPVELKLLGTTKNDEDALSRVRMMFRGRVDKVYVRTGQSVRRGDPLVDIYSTALADAKSDYEIRKVEWEYQAQLAKTREELREKASIAEQVYRETRAEEIRRRRQFEVAHDRLLIFGLTDEEIEKVDGETGAQKARMTLRSTAEGIVVERNVVAGNLYDESDTLLIVTPVDHLWVWGNVFESDLDLVHLGQKWEIEFPFQHSSVMGTIQYISNRVDPLTHAVRVRTSIPNPQGRLKSDMLVEGSLMIEPKPGRIEIPRNALIVAGNTSYVFVRVHNSLEKFERRRVNVLYESARHVLVDSGLAVGDEVVTTGALMVSQLFEDAQAGVSAPLDPETHCPVPTATAAHDKL